MAISIARRGGQILTSSPATVVPHDTGNDQKD